MKKVNEKEVTQGDLSLYRGYIKDGIERATKEREKRLREQYKGKNPSELSKEMDRVEKIYEKKYSRDKGAINTAIGNIQELEGVVENREDAIVIRYMLRRTGNKTAEKTAQKEIRKIVSKERDIKNVTEKLIDKKIGAPPTACSLYKSGSDFCIDEISEANRIGGLTYHTVSAEIVEEFFKCGLKNTISKGDSLRESVWQKYPEVREDEMEQHKRTYIKNELEEINIIKEFLNLDIPSEVRKQLTEDDSKKLEKYEKIMAKRKWVPQETENVYLQIADHREIKEKIKQALEELEKRKDSISPKAVTKIKQQLDKQSAQEGQKEDRLLYKFSKAGEKSGALRSITGASRYKKMIELQEIVRTQISERTSERKDLERYYWQNMNGMNKLIRENLYQKRNNIMQKEEMHIQ